MQPVLYVERDKAALIYEARQACHETEERGVLNRCRAADSGKPIEEKKATEEAARGGRNGAGRPICLREEKLERSFAD